jgi:hypothetical protein
MDATAGETAPRPRRARPALSPARALVRKIAADVDAELEDVPLDERDERARPPSDLSRFIAAHRTNPAPPPAPAVRKLEPATSREECRRCGIPGWKGCDHQLPFVALDPQTLKALGC